jgi:DnaJ-class molecular chaperone
MDKSYYTILNVSRLANTDEIKQAYRNLALRFHPDKNNSAGAEERFKEIVEAYGALMDVKKRGLYDHFREERLRHGSSPKSNSDLFGGPDITGFTGPNGFFDDEDFLDDMIDKMEDVSVDNDAGSRTRSRKTRSGPTFEDTFFRYDINIGDFRTPNKKPKIQDPSVEKELLVSLQEISTGVTKKLKISRKSYHQDGSYSIEDKILVVIVMPGWKEGTKITFSNEGDRNPGVIPADIIFKLKDKVNKDFSRDNENNLIYICRMPLRDALVGASIDIPTIDGKTLRITHDEIIQPGTQQLIKGEGLPLPKNPTLRADLIIKYDIFFPNYLSPHQRELIIDSLPR